VPCPAHIGIGTVIADRPSHTTKHTDHVLRRFG
jgi:riboflavin biosynthesis pyrimidine reductase